MFPSWPPKWLHEQPEFHANRWDSASTTLVVEVAGMVPEGAVRAAAGEVARIFPNSNDEKYGEPRALG